MNASLISDTKPRANRTMEAHVVLGGTEEQSASRTVTFPVESTLVALSISLSANGAPGNGLRRPTLQDLMIRLDSTELPLTRSRDDAGYGQYVSASALDLSNRYMVAQLIGATDITVQVRWKSPSPQAIYENTIVSIAFLYDTEGK